MRPLLTRAVPAAAVFSALLACASGQAVSAPKIAPGTPGAPVPAPAAQPAPAVVAAPRPGCDPCELLMTEDLDALASGLFCKQCGACDGFPHEAPVRCDEYDQLRNCIYARLGYDFDGAEQWRAVFDQEPWYEPDPKFKWSRVTDLQERNARGLIALSKGRSCVR